MTYEEAMGEVGRALALLLTDPRPVTDAALEPALAARESVLVLLAAQASDGALGRRASSGAISELVSNPTGAFNLLRSRLPRVAAENPHQLLAAQPQDDASSLWLLAHRNAVVATHLWRTAEPSSRPRGAATWPVTADAAALTAALTRLDPAIAGALRRAGRSGAAAVLEESRWSGLAHVTEAVGALAAAGDLSDPAPLRRPGTPAPVAVRGMAGLREGNRRLVTHLREQPLSPQALQVVMSRHGSSILTAADLVGPGALASSLTEHARRVALATRRLGAVASVEASDRRAPLQAHQIHAFLVDEARGPRRPEAGQAVARHAPVTIAALAERAFSDVQTGRWYVADGEDPGRPMWVQADHHDHRPEVLDHLKEAAEEASALIELVEPDESVRARVTPPRERLEVGTGLAARMAAALRPAVPAERLAPPGERIAERSLTM